MNEYIKKSFLKGRLVLLLGAGASKGCQNTLGGDIPSGDELAKILAEEMGEEYDGESLSNVYGAAKDVLGSQINRVLERHFKHCKPSQEYVELLRHPFSRIYTLNIDDAFEKAAYQQSGDRKFNVRHRCDCIEDVDQFYQTLDYIKLNGDIRKTSEGFIFSNQEYGLASTTEPFWYEELANDYDNYVFVFIGTELNEPLFYHQIEKYKNKSGGNDSRSYILIPSLSNINKKSLESNNIYHIEGVLSNFTGWLKSEFSPPLTGSDIVNNIRPELTSENKGDHSYSQELSGVIPINRASLALMKRTSGNSKIRNFYRGFKPNWIDITDSVPAYLERIKIFFEKELRGGKPKPLSLYLIFGAAGSGKTTALMQIALKLADENDRNVFYIEEYKNNISQLISELDQRNEEPYYVVVDRVVGSAASQISKIIEVGKSNAIFISSENPSIWRNRVKEHLASHVTKNTDISKIDPNDASSLLDKIKKFGHWTRLEKMSQKDRISELVDKSKKSATYWINGGNIWQGL